MYSKSNKKVLKEEKESSKRSSIKTTEQKNEVEVQQVGRPSFEDPADRLDVKVTVNLKLSEKDFLNNLQKNTGVPISTYLRRKLLEAKAFE